MTRLDQFAEYLAEGFPVKEAARLVYGTRIVGNAMLQRLRKRLGLEQCQ